MSSTFPEWVKYLPIIGSRIDRKKGVIRKEMRDLRRSLSTPQKQDAANQIFAKIELMPEFISSDTVLIYWSTKNEVPTHDFIRKWSETKKILLPSVKHSKLEIKPYYSNTKMKEGDLGIMEPDTDEVHEGSIHIVIVPGLAFDKKLNRLGRGKGFYDRYFHKMEVVKIGVGYDFQMVAEVPAFSKDQKMNKIVTPSAIYQ
jgi:5-formyltetrahydrofolate cyclo-ligase